MNVVVTAKLGDEKLLSKLVGLQNNPAIRVINLVRLTPVPGDKIQNINPPSLIAFSKLLFELWRLLVLIKLLLKQENQVVIGIQFFMHGFSAVLASFLTRKKSIVWLVGSDVMVHGQKKLVGPLFRLVLKRASVILVMGQQMKERLKFLSEKQVMEMQSFIDPARYFCRVEDCRTEESKIWDVGFVGNLEPVKQVDLLLRVVAQLKADGRKLNVLVAGTGSELATLRKLSEELEITGQVDFVGFQKDICSYLNQIKLLVLTSKSEGLPAVLLEAAFCGVPAVTPDVGEIKSYFRSYKNIEVVDEPGIPAMAETIIDCLDDASLYQLRVESAAVFSKVYLEQWGISGQVNHWEQVLNAALEAS